MPSVDPGDCYHVVVSLPRLSGAAEDTVVNTFSFKETNLVPDAGNAELVASFLASFYRDQYGVAPASVSEFLGHSLSREPGAVQIAVYGTADLSGGTPFGAPLFIGSITLRAPLETTLDLPGECAATLSFRSSYGGAVEEGEGGTRPRSRHRGRVYLGPLTTASMVDNEGVGFEPRLQSRFRDVMCRAAQKLQNDGLGASIPWSVWSRADEALYEVSVGWADNAFDVIRGRGQQATARTTFPGL